MKIQPRSLKEQVRGALLEGLESGLLAPGSRLEERPGQTHDPLSLDESPRGAPACCEDHDLAGQVKLNDLPCQVRLCQSNFSYSIYNSVTGEMFNNRIGDLAIHF